MKLVTATLAALWLALGAAGAAAAPSGPPSRNVAWLDAATDADIDGAFARARAQARPVLLYWGAAWCPPCNQLKATLFARQDFAVLARAFVAVHVDGDRPGAQGLGQRFRVSGYPTLVLFSPAGTETTRLPGEADAPQVLALMRLGIAGGRPVRALLDDALAGKPLSANEWRALAFYAWHSDEEQLVPRAEVPAVLVRLAVASADADRETTTRLWLKALAASDEGKGVKPDAALRERVRGVLADPVATRDHMDVIGGSAADLVRVLADGGEPQRSPFAPMFDAALRRLAADATLSRGDRQSAMVSRIELARLGIEPGAVRVTLPEPLLRDLRGQVARDDREISDGYERQAVIPGWGHALGLAGLWSESNALLEANLARSHSPYYLMSQLGANARKLGRPADALRWYRAAFDASVGPATRLQWGAGYLAALVDLTPDDAPRIEKTAARLFGVAAADPGSFEGRSARSLQRIGRKLVAWNGDGKQAAAMKRLQRELDGVCERLDATARASCQSLLVAAKAG